MRKCVIYARYSSDKQTEQSIEGQLKVCYEYAHKNDLIVLKEYIDRAMTGTNDNRKDFQKMLSDERMGYMPRLCARPFRQKRHRTRH